MKKIIFIVIMLITGLNLQAQVTKIRAFSNSLAKFNETTQKYDDWSEKKESNILIVIAKNTITVYSNETQKYSIVASGETDKNEDNQSCMGYECIDNEGIQCYISITLTKEELYIVDVKYADIIFRYNCKVEE